MKNKLHLSIIILSVFLITACTSKEEDTLKSYDGGKNGSTYNLLDGNIEVRPTVN